MDRRDFLKAAAATVAALSFAGAADTAEKQPKENDKPMLRKALLLGMAPEMASIEDRFKLIHDCGFEAVEVHPMTDPAEIKNTRAAADNAGVGIHSIIFGGWRALLSSPDPAVAEQGAAEVAQALKTASELGADGVLLVPARVDGVTRYVEAYERSQKHIRKLIPQAEKLKVRILVENVWNNFLLSPIEFARYIDELESPWVQAYFDVGNVVAFGWPEDWIRTLGLRIKKIHLKDFKRGPREWSDLREGDVNWPEVRKALGEVGFSGYLTPELHGGDEAYLRDISARMDKIIAGE